MTVRALPAWIAALFLSSVLFSHTVALRLFLLGIGAALAAWTLLRDRGGAKALPEIWLPFLLWSAWSAASLLWSIEPDRSEKELRNEVIYSGFALWVCYVCAQAPRAPKVVLPVVAAAVALACATAIYFFSPAKGKYLGGWHSGPGDHSSALLTVVPCLVVFGVYLASDLRSRLIALALGALIVASAYTTLNRTVWIGFTLELAIIGAFVLAERWRELAARVKLFAVTAAVILALGSAAMLATVQAEREATRSAVPVKQDPRLKLWPEVLRLIGERPATGYGLGRGLMRHELGERTGDIMLWHAHNLFLDVALQTGVPGLLLFLGTLLALARAAWAAARSPQALAKASGIALLAVLAGMVVRNMTDVLFARQNALLFWGVAGVLLAWSRSPARRPS